MRIRIDIPRLLHRPNMLGDGPLLDRETHVGKRSNNLVMQLSPQLHPPFVELLHPLVEIGRLRVPRIQKSHYICYQRLYVLFGNC